MYQVFFSVELMILLLLPCLLHTFVDEACCSRLHADQRLVSIASVHFEESVLSPHNKTPSQPSSRRIRNQLEGMGQVIGQRIRRYAQKKKTGLGSATLLKFSVASGDLVGPAHQQKTLEETYGTVIKVLKILPFQIYLLVSRNLASSDMLQAIARVFSLFTHKFMKKEENPAEGWVIVQFFNDLCFGEQLMGGGLNAEYGRPTADDIKGHWNFNEEVWKKHFDYWVDRFDQVDNHWSDAVAAEIPTFEHTHASATSRGHHPYAREDNAFNRKVVLRSMQAVVGIGEAVRGLHGASRPVASSNSTSPKYDMPWRDTRVSHPRPSIENSSFQKALLEAKSGNHEGKLLLGWKTTA